MSRAVLIAMAVLMLASCGVRRPLVRPADVPAYEAKRQKKLQQYPIEQAPQQIEPQGGPPHATPVNPSSPAPAAGSGVMSGGM